MTFYFYALCASLCLRNQVYKKPYSSALKHTQTHIPGIEWLFLIFFYFYLKIYYFTLFAFRIRKRIKMAFRHAIIRRSGKMCKWLK